MYEKRKPLMARKPSVVIAIGEKLGKKPPTPEPEQESESLTCPKCGMQLADTPENQEYAKARADEMDDSDEETE